MEFQYIHGVPLRRWDPASTYKYNWPFVGREKIFVNTFDFPSYIAYKGANFGTHLSTEYNTTAFQCWIRCSTISGQSPFEKILKYHKKTQTSHSYFAQTAEITSPLSTFPYDFIVLSLQIPPLLSLPHTLVLLSDNWRPVMKYSHQYLSSQYSKLPPSCAPEKHWPEPRLKHQWAQVPWTPRNSIYHKNRTTAELAPFFWQEGTTLQIWLFHIKSQSIWHFHYQVYKQIHARDKCLLCAPQQLPLLMNASQHFGT